MGQKNQIQNQIDALRVGPPPTPPQLSPSQQAQSAGIQQKRSDRKALKKQYKTSRRAANIAALMIQRGLHSAIGELEASGLQGPELSQAVREFAARQADAVAAARYRQNADQKDFQKADQSLAQDIQTGKVERNAAIQQEEQQHAEDVQTYNNKVAVVGLEAQKRAITAAQAKANSGASGGLTPAAARAQATARKNALIGLKGIFSSTAPVSSTDSTPVRERARQLLGQSRTAFIAAADKQIAGANQQDVAWALAQLQKQVQRATSGNAKALGKVQRGGYGGKTAQSIIGGQ